MARTMKHDAPHIFRGVVKYPWREEPEVFGPFLREGVARNAAEDAVRWRTDGAEASVQRAALVWEVVQ